MPAIPGRKHRQKEGQAHLYQLSRGLPDGGASASSGPGAPSWGVGPSEKGGHRGTHQGSRTLCETYADASLPTAYLVSSPVVQWGCGGGLTCLWLKFQTCARQAAHLSRVADPHAEPPSGLSYFTEHSPRLPTLHRYPPGPQPSADELRRKSLPGMMKMVAKCEV